MIRRLSPYAAMVQVDDLTAHRQAGTDATVDPRQLAGFDKAVEYS